MLRFTENGHGIGTGNVSGVDPLFLWLCHRKGSVLFPLEFQRINQQNALGRVHAMPSFANG